MSADHKPNRQMAMLGNNHPAIAAAMDRHWKVRGSDSPRVTYEHLTHDVDALFIGDVPRKSRRKIPYVFGLCDFVEMASGLEIPIATFDPSVRSYEGGQNIKLLDTKIEGGPIRAVRQWLGSISTFPLSAQETGDFRSDYLPVIYA